MEHIEKINAVVDYIEENMTSALSDKAMERIAGCSYDSLQRIFSYVTEQTIAEYVRGRRLTRAATELLNSDRTILELSARYGYESPDSFSRAFQRFHGILPSEMRRNPTKIRLHRRLRLGAGKAADKAPSDTLSASEETKGAMTMTAAYAEQNLDCTPEDKDRAMNTVNLLLALARHAKKEGLLSLAAHCDALGEAAPPLLRVGASYLADGLEPPEVRRLLENYLVFSRSAGRELLEGLLVVEALLAIQQGAYAHMLVEPLCSLFGLAYRERFYSLCDLAREAASARESLRGRTPLSPGTRLLERYHSLSPRSLQRLIRDVSRHTLAVALSGAGGGEISLFLENQSERGGQLTAGILGELSPGEAEIAAAQHAILVLEDRLRKQGEIP